MAKCVLTTMAAVLSITSQIALAAQQNHLKQASAFRVSGVADSVLMIIMTTTLKQVTYIV